MTAPDGLPLFSTVVRPVPGHCLSLIIQFLDTDFDASLYQIQMAGFIVKKKYFKIGQK